MIGTSSKMRLRSQADCGIVALGFANASHYVIKRYSDAVTYCFDLYCLQAWKSKSATKQAISSEYVLLD